MAADIKTIDGNEAAASVAYRVNEVCAIYPITPSSTMGELADQWASEGKANIWGTVPQVLEMQSEGGAAGAVHGALQTGALTTTFTASQGLLLMIPNMFKIAGELTPAVFHVAARALAAQALSIFGDHSDVMAARMTGWAMLCSSSVQEAHDLALVAQAATLASRIPFVHFFDGFRTSHEVAKIHLLADDDLRAMVDDELVFAHRGRALDPDRPVVRGVAQNPDVYFQGRETVNPFYAAVPGAVEAAMARFAARTGRAYRLFDYFGADDADRVVVLMGSGVETARETIDFLNARGARLGVVQVHLFRPFSADHLLAAIPATASAIAVLDRTKEPGGAGEPLYQDVVTAFAEGMAAGRRATMPRIVGGRYGLASKEFTPAMVKAVFDNLAAAAPRNHFTVGINDDVSHTSLNLDHTFVTEGGEVIGCIFYGLGADGTVGANKNSIKIIGEGTAGYAQGFFVYDSKKSGSRTTSHLRFGPHPIRSAYLVQKAHFIACHQHQFLDRIDMLAEAADGAVFLLNAPFGSGEVWDRLPGRVQSDIIRKHVRLFVIDADAVAAAAGVAGRINTVMQTCFFAISGVLPRQAAIARIKNAVVATYGRKGTALVDQNFAAIDRALEHLHEVPVPKVVTSNRPDVAVVPDDAPEFVRHVTAKMIAGRGDELPVSAIPADGTYPSGTSRWEKRNIADAVPVWSPHLCVQCGNCVMVCPHASIRSRLYDQSLLADAPSRFASAPLAGRGFPGKRFTIQVAVEDCTGCELCVEACPVRSGGETAVRALAMRPKDGELVSAERAHLAFFNSLPELTSATVDPALVRGAQYLTPLFEYSGACAGCGETPYLRLLTQLFGDRLLVANATGCSSIYGGNLPTTPWSFNKEGRGPAWSNSLFEDNAEFGLGYRVSLDKHREQAEELLAALADDIGPDLVEALRHSPQLTTADIDAQRSRVAALDRALMASHDPRARQLRTLAGYLVRKSVWIVGGDGWAYDIGYGGLDHVLASGRNVNLLVLDTEVYSNTGGQASKATPRGSVARFAAGGKPSRKKDLGLMAMGYGNVYVAQVAMGASAQQTLDALQEAESHQGPSLVIAYGHCIAHGIDMRLGLRQQKLAVDCGHWPLYRFRPSGRDRAREEFVLDSPPPSIPLKAYAYNEVRYRMLADSKPDEAARLLALAQEDVNHRWRVYQDLACRWPGPAGNSPLTARGPAPVPGP
ncbi:MAG TPA: pyruvate:ferredoxin (flavodoxin) oxidoreductase [Vicinamibacterales bacterium]|nr:pyruvate:ferredoxin (flavodoxin) oxidoreductase [Vicinamibacterales bacterium]